MRTPRAGALRAASLFVVVACAGALAALWALRRSGRLGGASSGAPAFPLELYAPDLWGGPSITAARVDRLRRYASYAGGGSFVTQHWDERDPDDPSVWHRSRVKEATAYRTTALAACEGGTRFYVAGILPSGEDVLEEWSYPLREGGYALVRANGSPAALGQPMQAFEASIELRGERFEPPPASWPPPATRRELYRGSELGHLSALASDPEGRFLLAVTWPAGELLHLDPHASPMAVEVLAPEGEFPALERARSLGAFQHLTLERLYLSFEAHGCIASPDERHLVVGDADNDGRIDFVESYTRSELGQRYGEPSWRPLVDLRP